MGMPGAAAILMSVPRGTVSYPSAASTVVTSTSPPQP